jgi:uncharacterized protein (TIGR03067 family)
MVAAKAGDEGVGRDVQPVLHEEINRLPDRYRQPVVLCYLQGKTNEEAAQFLNWPVGTVKGRLARARDLLRGRLARRGLALSAGLVATALSQNTASAAVPAGLLEATVRAGMGFATPGTAAAGLVSSQVAALTQGVLHGLAWVKVKIAAALVLALGLLGAGACHLLYHPGTRQTDDGKAEPAKPARLSDQEKIQGTWKAVACQVEGQDMDLNDPRFETQWTFRGNNLTITAQGLTNYSTFQLDPARKPKGIDMLVGKDQAGKGDGKTSLGVYELDGDTLKICVFPNKQGRPAAVAARRGDGAFVLIFKRQPPAARKGPPAK